MRKTLKSLPLFICLISASVFPASSIAAKNNSKDHPWYVSVEDYEHARSAMKWAQKQKWQDSKSHEEMIKDPTARKIFQWMKYTSDTEGMTFSEITNFIRKNPKWPKQDLLLEHAENAISVATPATEIIEWFTKEKPLLGKRKFREPVTYKGKIFLAEAELKYKSDFNIDEKQANDLIRQVWINYPMGQKDEDDFLAKYRSILKHSDHVEKIDLLLWDEKISAAQRLIKFVDGAHQKLFNARIALIKNGWSIDKLVNAIPKDLQSDQGLLFDRIRWRDRRKMDNAISELLNYAPPNPQYPVRWWKYKARQIQEDISKSNFKRAYKLATNHGLTSGVEFAEAEWIAGRLALKYLNDPQAAYRHFYNLYQGVVTPISLSRGAYWSARAAEANKNMDIAQSWYFAAAKYPTTFYGQLASRRLGSKSLTFPKEPQSTIVDVDYYHANELVKAAYILHNLERSADAKLFLKKGLENAKSLGEISLIARLGSEIGRPDYSIDVAREVSKSGLVLTKAHYPVLPKIVHPKTRKEIARPEKSLVHGIILQESMFFKQARSNKGANGLMQVMPATARSMAKKLHLVYSPSHMAAEDPSYNITIGSKFLEHMIDEWDGSYVLAIAAYNAGPGNVNKWIKKNGDPRKMKTTEQIIDWIELIPFYETRNYVQRVLENIQIYRYILGVNASPTTNIVEDLKR